MKRSAIVLALIVMLLSAVIGFHGCGRTNNLTSIAVTPANPIIAKDTALQLTVTAKFSDGLTVSPWNVVTWQSSDSSIINVDTAGRITGIAAGSAVITAIDNGHPDITSSITVIVTKLDSLTISPLSAVISLTTSTQFTATGLYSADTPSSWSTSTTWPLVDLTTLVSWVSSSTDVALFSNPTSSQGLVTASTTTTGTTTISATYSGITVTTDLTVTP
jgi:hypothetical protein